MASEATTALPLTCPRLGYSIPFHVTAGRQCAECNHRCSESECLTLPELDRYGEEHCESMACRRARCTRKQLRGQRRTLLLDRRLEPGGNPRRRPPQPSSHQTHK